jgi:hypothetical protein
MAAFAWAMLSQNGTGQYFRVEPRPKRIDFRGARVSATCCGVNLPSAGFGVGAFFSFIPVGIEGLRQAAVGLCHLG